jgi:adenine C2-methylase RlmN of 23S rRNA A2503 and tRNA A37
MAATWHFLPRLMEAVRDYQAASGQRVFVEYVMLAGGWVRDARAGLGRRAA